MKTAVAALFLLVASVAGAQNPPATPAPVQPQRILPAAQRNVRFDIAITDNLGAKPVVKNLSIIATEGSGFQGGGSIRNSARLPGSDPNIPAGFVIQDKDGKQQTLQPLAGGQTVPLNVDVTEVRFMTNDTIKALVRIEYQPYVPDAKSQPAVITASANVAFENGKKTTILQTTDPITDRRTTIEVTATILK